MRLNPQMRFQTAFAGLNAWTGVYKVYYNIIKICKTSCLRWKAFVIITVKKEGEQDGQKHDLV